MADMTAEQRTTQRAPARERPRRRSRGHGALPVLLVLPAALLLGLVLVVPMCIALWSSLFSLNILNLADQKFIGLDNYTRLMGDPAFWHALLITGAYTLCVLVGAYALGLVTALLLRPKFPGRGAARTVAILPWAVPQVVAVLVWVWMFDSNYGVVNYLLQKVGIGDGHLKWLEDGQLAFVAVVVVSVWVLYPVATTMLLAGLQGIGDELYEAARMDGASRWQQFRYVTLPGLAPVNLVLVLLLVLLGFTRVVTIIYVMTGGGPGRATETLPLQTYLEAFKYHELGYASAVGTTVLILAAGFAMLYFTIASRVLPKT
ncbi:MAG: sugar ABC transporter permease [Actinocatenispora sp.]